MFYSHEFVSKVETVCFFSLLNKKAYIFAFKSRRRRRRHRTLFHILKLEMKTSLHIFLYRVLNGYVLSEQCCLHRLGTCLMLIYPISVVLTNNFIE